MVVIAALVLVAGLIGSCGRVAATPDDRSPAEGRMHRLARGVNLSQWFAQAGSSPAHLQTAITADDVQRIRRMGFDHVRLPVDPVVLAQGWTLDAPDEDTLYYLDDAVRLLLDGGLAVVVDLHPDATFKERLAADPGFVELVARMWTMLARRLASTDPDRLFLEVLNEPGFADATAWATVQLRLVAAIREGAPSHTIIATGHAWSGVEQIEALEPLADANVAYAFHFYEPYLFTHQGATWGRGAAGTVRAVPYPSSPTAIQAALGSTGDPAGRAALVQYGQERWDAPAIDAAIERAAAWGYAHHVPVICGELGVYRTVAPPADRIRWLQDVRRALEARGIGWTSWEYAGGFGVVDGPPGGRVIHAPTARALLGQ